MTQTADPQALPRPMRDYVRRVRLIDAGAPQSRDEAPLIYPKDGVAFDDHAVVDGMTLLDLHLDHAASSDHVGVLVARLRVPVSAFVEEPRSRAIGGHAVLTPLEGLVRWMGLGPRGANGVRSAAEVDRTAATHVDVDVFVAEVFGASQ